VTTTVSTAWDGSTLSTVQAAPSSDRSNSALLEGTAALRVLHRALVRRERGMRNTSHVHQPSESTAVAALVRQPRPLVMMSRLRLVAGSRRERGSCAPAGIVTAQARRATVYGRAAKRHHRCTRAARPVRVTWITKTRTRSTTVVAGLPHSNVRVDPVGRVSS
jgi:hypothetical protein